MHLYEVRPRRNQRGVDLISDAPPFEEVWYDTPDNAVGYAMHSSRSHDAVIRVYDGAGVDGTACGSLCYRSSCAVAIISAAF